jgi:hypothetical protein
VARRTWECLFVIVMFALACLLLPKLDAAWNDAPLGAHVAILTIVLPLAIVGIVRDVRTRRRKKRGDRGECLACGYSLTGNASGVCPECGHAVAQPARPGGVRG